MAKHGTENFDTADNAEEQKEAEQEALEEEKDLRDAVEEEIAKELAEDEEGADEADEEDSESDAADDGEENGEKSSKKKDRKDALIEDLQDRVKRQMAEFENFRKRTEKEKSRMFSAGEVNVIEKMLPIVDNFERGLAGATEGDAFADGMQMIYKQMMTAFEQLGVTPIEAVGKEFDPEVHNAVMHVDDEKFGENEIVEEMQKGYMLHDEVIRHSMVKVAN